MNKPLHPVQDRIYQQLPVESRHILDCQTPSVVNASIMMIGGMMETFSDLGADLDPIQWDIVLQGITESIVRLMRALRDEENLVEILLGGPE